MCNDAQYLRQVPIENREFGNVIRKRYLVHFTTHNIRIVMSHLFGIGRPRERRNTRTDMDLLVLCEESAIITLFGERRALCPPYYAST